jgi:hypothetical protein
MKLKKNSARRVYQKPSNAPEKAELRAGVPEQRRKFTGLDKAKD